MDAPHYCYSHFHIPQKLERTPETPDPYQYHTIPDRRTEKDTLPNADSYLETTFSNAALLSANNCLKFMFSGAALLGVNSAEVEELRDLCV
jgi:hypothetical protein